MFSRSPINKPEQPDAGQLKNLVKRQKGCCAHCDFEFQSAFKASLDSEGRWELLCHICFDVANVDINGESRSNGVVVMVPGMSQAQLNMLCHCSWAVAKLAPERLTSFQGEQQRAKIKQATFDVIQLFGNGADKFPVFASVIENLPEKLYANRHKLLENLLYLPAMEDYEVAVNHWAETVYPKYRYLFEKGEGT
ncbi:hypothetical protein [Idiomarina abyssalis]|uniref:Uncharacterized protein n=1 Tax=Idiomarina abyssalis TaxID=86102 RepID=A0A8I1GAP7_9GAMM|nr:hypothetical protein [Idiomarina abyssalis]MBJ7265576.1 hypothetical protein [Idiomarina abyssalis]MBJ7316750.1 hypothetical protein [Idiomarina abyssalis]